MAEYFTDLGSTSQIASSNLKMQMDSAKKEADAAKIGALGGVVSGVLALVLLKGNLRLLSIGGFVGGFAMHKAYRSKEQQYQRFVALYNEANDKALREAKAG